MPTPLGPGGPSRTLKSGSSNGPDAASRSSASTADSTGSSSGLILPDGGAGGAGLADSRVAAPLLLGAGAVPPPPLPETRRGGSVDALSVNAGSSSLLTVIVKEPNCSGSKVDGRMA